MQEQHAGPSKLTETIRSTPSPTQPETGSVKALASGAVENDQPPPPAKRQRRDQAVAAQVARSNSRAPRDVETDAALCTDPIQIEQSLHLKLLKRWAAVKESFESKRLAATVNSNEPRYLDILLSSPAIAGRQWECNGYSFVTNDTLRDSRLWHSLTGSQSTSDYHLVLLKNSASSSPAQPAEQRTAHLPQELITDDHDLEILVRFTEQLCHLLNRVPNPVVDLRPGNPVSHFLIVTALRRARKAQGRLLPSLYRDLFLHSRATRFGIQFVAKPLHEIYTVELSTFDKKLRPQTCKVTFDLKDIAGARTIPVLPGDVVSAMPAPCYTVHTEGGEIYALDISALSAQKQVDHATALQLARHLQLLMYGVVGNEGAIQKQARAILALYTKDRPTYGDELWELQIMTDRVHVYPAAAFCSEIERKASRVSVLGRSKGRLSAVLEEIHQAFSTGSMLPAAFQAGILKADMINMMPVWKRFALCCDHVGEELESAVHASLAREREASLAREREASQARLAREREASQASLAREHDASQAWLAREHEASLARARKASQARLEVQERVCREAMQLTRRLRHLLRKTLYREAQKSKGATAQDGSEHDRYAIASRFAENWFNPMSGLWADAYIDVERPEKAPVPRADSTRPTPLIASVDAAHPFYVEGASGEVSIHHENNIAPCAFYVNCGLNTWLKGNLQVVKDALDLRGSDYSAYADVNNRFDNLWAIRGKYPHGQSARLNIRMDVTEYQRCCDEWREGLLADADEIVPFYINQKSLSKPTWTQSDKARFTSLIEQMSNLRPGPIELLKGADGAPFPWRPEHMPPDWSYELLEGKMAYHFDLMDKWCDRHFTTEESPETIFLEVLWQWFDNGGRDVFLGLPMTIFAGHATAFALGHLHHGRPMRTGWPLDVVITSLSQRDGSRCNVLVETRISNYIKMDFSETEYQAIRDDIQHCKDDTKWFTRPLGPVPPINVQRASKLAVLRRSKQWVTAGSRAEDDAGDDLDDEVNPEDIPDEFAEDEAVLGQALVD
ncbi:hypothetical protein LTS02_015985 [Friedmanniomyces endolithicus]|nr:hypothetical protein LTS02_015985 [Friedmanniomyces endolithicus]